MLYDMSGNNTIHRFQAMLLPIFNYVNKGLNPQMQKPTGDLVTHRELVEELRNGTPDGFRNKMHNHLWYYFQKV
jgi:GntR family transcriptional regulator, transcriptional repressor for pyruvate dehydrogenase complex